MIKTLPTNDMKTIKVDYNLQNITQKPEAYLSDLFIILYSMFLTEKHGVYISRYSINKLFPYIFEKLEEKGEKEDLQIFNLPFYRMDGGHYNKTISTKYLKRLEAVDLIRAKSRVSYSLTPKAKALLQDFYDNEHEEPSTQEFENFVVSYTEKYIKDRSKDNTRIALRNLSHTMLVEDAGERKTVDDLDISDFKAIAYNNKNFRTGELSNIVPKTYITLLADQLSPTGRPKKESLDYINKLLPNKTGT